VILVCTRVCVQSIDAPFDYLLLLLRLLIGPVCLFSRDVNSVSHRACPGSLDVFSFPFLGIFAS
jgi:hypothetical protein